MFFPIRSLPIVLLSLAAPSPGGDEPPAWGRGPLPVRDPHVLAQLRLTLHAFSPETAPAGGLAARLEATWGNTFSESPDVYTIDAETLRTALELRTGVTDSIDVGIEIPYAWRSGGVLDGLAEFQHDTFGVPDGDRDDAPEDRFEVRVAGRAEGQIAELEPSKGLGDLVLSSKWRFLEGSATTPAIAALAEVRLPTAQRKLGATGADYGIAGVVSQRFLERFVAYGGGGTTFYFPDDEYEDFEFRTVRNYGFLALEWEALDWASLVLQADVASDLIDRVVELEGPQSYIQLGAKVDWGRVRIDLGFVENIADQDTTADFAFFFSVGSTF